MATGKRAARIELVSNASGLDKGLNDARRKLRMFQRDQDREAKRSQKTYDRGVSRATKSTIGMARSLSMGMAAAAGLDIAGGIGNMASSVFDFEKELTRFQIDAQLSGKQVAAFRDQIMDTSQATGVSRLELLKGAHAYQILTGDAAGAVKMSRLFADVANASGASMDDIAGAAGSLHQNLGFDDTSMRKAFDVMLSMGHKGSVELRDFAGELSGIAPQFKEFGAGTDIEKFTELAAAAQGVRKNFGDASEMATGFRAIMNQLSKSKVAGAFAAHGVDIWRIDPKTKQHVKRDFFDIVADIKQKIPDQKVLQDILGGRQESSRALQALVEHWDEIVQLQQQAADSNQVARDSQTYLESSTGRIARAWENLKNVVAQALTPERIALFASALEKAVELAGDLMKTLNDFAAWVGEHTPKSAQAAADEATAGMTPEQKAQFAAKMNAEGQGTAGYHKQITSGLLGALGLGDFSNTDVGGDLGDAALALVGDQIGNSDVLTGRYAKDIAGRVDPWSYGRGGGMSMIDYERLAAAMAKVTIVVRASQNDIANAGRNAPIQGTRPGGRH